MFSQDSEHPSSLLDGLYCEDERLDFEDVCDSPVEGNIQRNDLFDGFCDDGNDGFSGLLSKEKETILGGKDLIRDGSLMVARKVALDWLIRVCAHYGFVAKTTFLAFNFFDRFLFSNFFQKDKPWMSQLSAVACLSLAAKVEETQAPLLLDLQVEESKYVFESKTIMRMELLVLSTLEWKMNPVTPLSYIDHFASNLGLKNDNLHWEFLMRCERLLLSVISDSRFLDYLPSVVAVATIFLVLKEFEPCYALEFQDQLKGFQISKETLDDCRKLIIEVSNTCGFSHGQSRKRKNCSRPGSPNGVVDAYFSSDSSNDSGSAASSVSSSPEPLYKKSRARDQQIRLAPINRLSIGVLSSSR